jgi:hypothetical protein
VDDAVGSDITTTREASVVKQARGLWTSDANRLAQEQACCKQVGSKLRAGCLKTGNRLE